MGGSALPYQFQYMFSTVVVLLCLLLLTPMANSMDLETEGCERRCDGAHQRGSVGKTFVPFFRLMTLGYKVTRLLCNRHQSATVPRTRRLYTFGSCSPPPPIGNYRHRESLTGGKASFHSRIINQPQQVFGIWPCGVNATARCKVTRGELILTEFFLRENCDTSSRLGAIWVDVCSRSR